LERDQVRAWLFQLRPMDAQESRRAGTLEKKNAHQTRKGTILQQKQQKPDYTALLALFHGENELTLTDGMELSAEAAQQLEVVIDKALSDHLAALPGGKAIEIVNREQAFRGQLPFISLHVGKGIISLGAVQLRLLSFRDVQARLETEAEAFKLFLMDQNYQYWTGYLYNLSPWVNIEPKDILAFRTWLRTPYPAETHPAKLQALTTYLCLAEADGVIDKDDLDKCLEAINKPLPARKRRS
jgi:hypothetical protein